MTFDAHAALDSPLLTELADISRTHFAPRERQTHETVSMPMENLRELWRLGLLTATVSRAHGGLGSNVCSDDPATFLQAIRIVARVSPGTAHCLQVQNHAAWAIDEIGTPAQQARFVAPMFESMKLCSFVGSEAGRKQMYTLKTTARPTADGYIVRGAKNYATNGFEDGLAVAFAAVEGEPDPMKAHLMVLVEPGMAGASANHDWYRPSGMRACPSPEIYLDDVHVPASHVLGEPGTYPRGRWQGRFHLGFTANYLGMAEGMYDYVLRSLRERGRGRDPFVQLRIGEAHTKLHGAQVAFEDAIASWTRGDVQQAELTSMEAKSICAHAALDISRSLVMLAGSTAMFDEFPLGRLVRDLETHILHVGHDKTSQIVGAAQLGEAFDSTLQR